MVKRFVFAVPGDLATPTGGYGYDRRMIAELGELGWQADLLDLGEGFPWPDAATRANADALLLAVPAGRIIVVDGLALGVLPETAARLAGRNPLLALVHHPLALEWGLSARASRRLARRASGSRSAAAQAVVVTSAATARLVASDYAVPAERIAVARPGSDPAPLAQGSRDGIVRLLSVGAIVPRKGFEILVAALAMLTDLNWRLTIAGDRTRDPDAAARLDAAIAHHGLGDRIAVAGRGIGGTSRGALRRSRHVRSRLAFRRLRHGLCRGDRAWRCP